MNQENDIYFVQTFRLSVSDVFQNFDVTYGNTFFYYLFSYLFITQRLLFFNIKCSKI